MYAKILRLMQVERFINHVKMIIKFINNNLIGYIVKVVLWKSSLQKFCILVISFHNKYQNEFLSFIKTNSRISVAIIITFSEK